MVIKICGGNPKPCFSSMDARVSGFRTSSSHRDAVCCRTGGLTVPRPINKEMLSVQRTNSTLAPSVQALKRSPAQSNAWSSRLSRPSGFVLHEEASCKAAEKAGAPFVLCSSLKVSSKY